MEHQEQSPQALERSEQAALLAVTMPDPDVAVSPELTDDPEFAAEVAEFEAVAAALPYSLPLAPLAPDLKSRLFERIAPPPAPNSEELFALLSLSITELKHQAAQLDWEPFPVMAGASIATWKTDQATREAAFFVRVQLPGQFPNHHHASGEGILVLEGDFVVDGQVYGIGERIDSAADTSHAPSTHSGCLIFCVSSLDDKLEPSAAGIAD